MNINFSDIIFTRIKKCKNCFTVVYSLPCEISKDVVSYFKSFGPSKYNLDIVKLLQIETSDGYKIKAKLGATSIDFSIPKDLENTYLTNPRKSEFENSIVEWLQDILGVKIKK